MIYDLAPDLYDLQYESYRDDVPFYLRLADDLGGPVLELGAGTGRITEALANAGHKVVAVDASAAMLARAETRLGSHLASGKVRLVQADMRAPGVDGLFPLVIAPFNTLMHAYTPGDQDLVLSAVAKRLAPGGTFAFDVYQPHLGPTGVLRREREWAGVAGAGSELFLVQYHDRDAQLVESVYLLDETGPEGALRRRSARLLQRYYTRFELERALAQAGFTWTQVYGGFERQRLGADSLTMVALARSA